MPALAALQVQDLRPDLSVKNSSSRRQRSRPVTSLTLHYNGPRVAGFGDPDRERRQVVEIDTPYQQKRLGADSLMYHLVVLSDGSVHQTRDYGLRAWHCRHRVGNEQSLAIHLPLGGTQDATAAQWDATTRLFDALIQDYGLDGRSQVRGHLEWAPTDCPGPFLMRRLRAWRAGTPRSSDSAGGLYRVRRDISSALVRSGPGRQHDVRGRMWPGDLLEADGVERGEAIGSEDRWLRRSDGLGYVHASLAKAVR